MDRIEFVQAIKRDNMELAEVVIKFFDQYMLLYNLVDTVDDISIINSNDMSVCFELRYINPESATKLLGRLGQFNTMISYETPYNVFATPIDVRTLNIEIKRI